MPKVGGKQHHCRYCSSTSSNTKGVGYCADHQEVCQDPDGLHKGVTMYKYKKTSVSNAEECIACKQRREQNAAKERKEREAEEKSAFTKEPQKERKPRHSKPQ
jgi:hypothetical protein